MFLPMNVELGLLHNAHFGEFRMRESHTRHDGMSVRCRPEIDGI